MVLLLQRFWLVFFPLFVAFDVLGLVPVYWALAHGLPPATRRRAVDQACMVALGVALAFLWLSGFIFRAMGIRVADVLIAGGMILFVLSLNELLHPEKTQYGSTEGIGAVPLGVPLIVGPAVLTTILLVRQQSGISHTLIAIMLNILVSWMVLQVADTLMERLGREGARVLSKVANLVLAAFAEMLTRHGFASLIPGLINPQ